MSEELSVTPELIQNIFKSYKNDELLEKINEDDIKIICEQKDIKLPQVLIWLLCNVSQELWFDKTQYKINLEDLPNSNELDSLYLNKNNYTVDDFFFSKDDNKNEFQLNVNDDGKIYYPVFEKYMFQFSNNDYVYLGQGPLLGRVLTKSDTPYKWEFKNNNMEEYLINFLQKEFSNKLNL